MTPIAGMQQAFQEYILRDAAGMSERIEGNERMDPERRLRIYYDAYRLRLIEVLGTDYEVLHAYLGDELFNALADGYVAAHPSTFRNVRWFGGKLAEFLGATPRYAEHPELAELAQF